MGATDNVDGWTWADYPKDAAGFDEMMISLDQHLAACGLQPFQRGLNGVRLVSMRLGLSGHNIFPTQAQRGAPFSPTDLLGRVHDWYDANYADRMHMNMSPGNVIFQMRATLWRLRLPKVFGRVDMFLNRDLSKEGAQVGSRARPASHNLLRSIDGMTQTYADHLSNEELQLIASAFLRGNGSLVYLDGLKGHDLFEQARNDHRHAVDALLDGRALSKARWDTSQCAEKVFKGLLGSAGHSYPTNAGKGHDIPHLGNLVRDHLRVPLPEPDLTIIHCSPAVRYAEAQVSGAEALASHDALLRVLAVLATARTHP